MSKVFLVIFISVAVKATVASIDNDWIQYKLMFNKTFNPSEDLQRRSVFKHKRSIIDHHNARFKKGLETYSMAVNDYTDKMSDDLDEGMVRTLSQMYWDVLNNFSIPIKELDDRVAPKEWSWKTLDIPVARQICDSCYTFSVTGMIEHHLYHFKNRNVRLSQQELLDCDYELNWQCKGGVDFVSLDYIKRNGISLLEKYPFEGQPSACKATRDTKSDIRISAIYRTDTSEESIKNHLYQHGPLSLPISLDINFQLHESGVFDSDTCVEKPEKPIRHFVTLVGYGTDENGLDYWEVKNSWGKRWGEEGYGKIIRNKKMCNIGGFPAFFVELED